MLRSWRPANSIVALLTLAQPTAAAFGCGKSTVETSAIQAADAAPALIEGEGITVSHVWTWSPKETRPGTPAGLRPVETFVTLTAARGYLRAPAKSVHLVTVSGARFPVAEAAHSTCTDLLALGETRSCIFLFAVPVSEQPDHLELRVPPQSPITVGVANPPPTSSPCAVASPCTPCVFPASGVECQRDALARGLESTCTFDEGGSPRRKTTLYCPPGYRKRVTATE